MFTAAIKNNKGVALIIALLLMSLLLFLAIYLLNFSLAERKISRSQTWGIKTYYLAEAGVQELIWRIKNDYSLRQSFEEDDDWTYSFTRDNPFGANSGSYTVNINNTGLAHGTITSTGSLSSGGQTSQRIVKTYVYKAMGQSQVEDNGGYADGNIDISFSMVNFHDGSAHSNNNFIINGISTVEVDGDLKAVGQYNKSWLSTVNVSGDTFGSNMPSGPASPIDMPAIDFDSAASSSLKNRASAVYSQAEFSDLMEDNQSLNLPGPITYVDGDVELRGAQTLTINGLLVVGRDLIIGHYPCWGWRCGRDNITVTHASGTPAGILAKRKINFESWSGDTNIEGLVYANDQMNIVSFPVDTDFDVTGGLIGRKLTITSTWWPVNIYFNNNILTEVLGATEYSPVITVEHWEEEY